MINKKTKERFNKLLEGYAITHATIANKERIAFITKKVEEESLKPDNQIPTDLLLYDINKGLEIAPDEYGLLATEWGRGVHSAWVAFNNNQTSMVLATRHAQTLEFLSDDLYNERVRWKNLPNPTNTDKAMIRYIKGVKSIDNEVYMFGGFRKLYKYLGNQEWSDESYEESHPNLHLDLENYKKEGVKLMSVGIGFNDIDGFSKSEIYACGDGGDLWYFNGERWKRLDPPVNSDLNALLCAPDGNVYIGMGTADILKGKYDAQQGEQWEIIKGDSTEIFSLAWFQDRVYIGSESGLYFINQKNSVEKYSFPEDGFQQYSFKNVASSKDALLSYGHHQALVFDGKEWDELVGSRES